ncbi:hypothetical protein C8J25_103149 [Sphingomonas faeni]|uniref:Uncharacterized protein n=1 Tax=Sphingomonas faeni TaxID=185950 RepID=A0A2T5U7H8_9SPHN|nr:hypothetical protein C8J25_103149 [Sphingomonas faeni]
MERAVTEKGCCAKVVCNFRSFRGAGVTLRGSLFSREDGSPDWVPAFAGKQDYRAGIVLFRNATLSANTGALPRNGFDNAIATFSWLNPG